PFPTRRSSALSAAGRPAGASPRVDSLFQGASAEEVGMADRLDDHDDHAQGQHTDAEDEDESDAEDRGSGSVVGVERIDRGGDEDEQPGNSPDKREEEPEEERAC